MEKRLTTTLSLFEFEVVKDVHNTQNILIDKIKSPKIVSLKTWMSFSTFSVGLSRIGKSTVQLISSAQSLHF